MMDDDDDAEQMTAASEGGEPRYMVISTAGNVTRRSREAVRAV